MQQQHILQAHSSMSVNLLPVVTTRSAAAAIINSRSVADLGADLDVFGHQDQAHYHAIFNNMLKLCIVT